MHSRELGNWLSVACLMGCLATSACVNAPGFACTSDADCGEQRRCEPQDPKLPASAQNTGICSEAATDCASGRRAVGQDGEHCITCGQVGGYCCGNECDVGAVCGDGRCSCVAAMDVAARGVLSPTARYSAFTSDPIVGMQLSLVTQLEGAAEVEASVLANGGGDGVCGRFEDGLVRCVRLSNPEAYTEPVTDAIALGSNCAVHRDTSVTCWEYDGTVKHIEITGAVQAEGDMGGTFGNACALLDDGTMWCWGDNDYGQLGDGTKQDRASPVQVVGIPEAVSIYVDSLRSCAVGIDGKAWCWGGNHHGELGNGTTEHSINPAPVLNLEGVTEFYGGSRPTCARTGENEIWCWGQDVSLEPHPDMLHATRVVDLPGVHVAARTAAVHAGTLYGWAQPFPEPPLFRARALGNICP